MTEDILGMFQGSNFGPSHLERPITVKCMVYRIAILYQISCIELTSSGPD
jgi:hypothetical protein